VNNNQHVYMRGVVAVGSTCRCGADADVTFHHPDGGEWDVCEDCGIRQAQRISASICQAVESLVAAQSIVDETVAEHYELKAKIAGAAEDLAKLGNVPMCDVEWCESKGPGHKEHEFDRTITSKCGGDHLEIGAGIDLSGDYDNEIGIRAWWQDGDQYESVSIHLTVEQAREAISLIELAIARRAELRGLPR
jgi:hypothetical protein